MAGASTRCWESRPDRTGDVDLVIEKDDLPAVRAVLDEARFVVIRDWLPSAIAFRHADGREADLHPIEPTPDGGGDQVMPDGTWWHHGPPATGRVAGITVRCCSLETQLRSHVGYEPDADDVADMVALAARFDCELPMPYRP